jgi:hypothetical protein
MALHYTDDNRGKIQFRGRAQQIKDFSGMRIGNITPTDIDAFIEYKNKCFIVIELKSENSMLSFGQKLAFERMIKSFDKPSIFILCEHTTHDSSDDIPVSLSKVIKVFTKKWGWQEIEHYNLIDLVNKYIEYIDSK